MVTFSRVGLLLLLIAAACDGRSSARGPDGRAEARAGSAESAAITNVEPGGTGASYPGSGLRVHEWGTNTIVVGSNGATLRGLHHEEEDLPGFVYDRRQPALQVSSTSVKMETPVTYFYSEAPLVLRVAVRFPSGIFTQWYPAVASFWPPTIRDRGDPALDLDFPYSEPSCRDRFAVVSNGLLDWGEVHVLGRTEAPPVPEAPLEKFAWSFAREVAANAVRVGGEPSQAERFLFYRGLGNFPIDLEVARQDGDAGRDGGLVLSNVDGAAAVGAVFVLRVTRDKAAFVVHPQGVSPGASLLASAPEPTQPLDEYAQSLAAAMVVELDKTGLYHDESVAMVKTWARQWFRSPGVRVLYLAPQAWTERQIPLTIEPPPLERVRTMVIRVEFLTPAVESVDVAAVMAGDDDHFRALGRFAEPRLRRAIELSPSPPAAAFALLDSIAAADVSARVSE